MNEPMDIKDRKETTYNRDVGFPCRKCGHQTTPLYMGNALAGYRCDCCNEEIEP